MTDLICPKCKNNINDQETGTWFIMQTSGLFHCACWECEATWLADRNGNQVKSTMNKGTDNGNYPNVKEGGK